MAAIRAYRYERMWTALQRFYLVQYLNSGTNLRKNLSHWIYRDQTLLDMKKPAWWGGLGMLLVGLIVAIPKMRRGSASGKKDGG